MKKMNFEQMEIINGGESMATVDTSVTQIDTAYKQSCLAEGAVFLASTILSFGTTGLTAGLSWSLTAWAYKDYFMCQYKNMS
jgi:hypothetical protein